MLVEHTTLDCVFSLCIFGGSVNEVSSMDVDCCGSVAEVSYMETGSRSLVDEVALHIHRLWCFSFCSFKCG